MKKIFLAIVLGSALVSCKKETTNLKNSSNNTINTSTCVDNPNINFKSIGTPIGKFGDCIKDIEGNTYKTAVIGSQTWMAENLKTSKYNDGSIITNVTDPSNWIKLNSGAWGYYNNDVVNNAKYGKLYNWYAVNMITNGNKNVCPTGWHVPSDAEWTILTDFLGGEIVAASKMKEVGNTSWSSQNFDATNVSLFAALPGGSLDESDGLSYELGERGVWWSASEDVSDKIGAIGSWLRLLDFKKVNSYRISGDKRNGMSIRCIKD